MSSSCSFFLAPADNPCIIADCERSGVDFIPSVRHPKEKKAFALDRMHAANIPLGIAACLLACLPACLLACLLACFATVA
jgi:hypothetical protein